MQVPHSEKTGTLDQMGPLWPDAGVSAEVLLLSISDDPEMQRASGLAWLWAQPAGGRRGWGLQKELFYPLLLIGGQQDVRGALLFPWRVLSGTSLLPPSTHLSGIYGSSPTSFVR